MLIAVEMAWHWYYTAMQVHLLHRCRPHVGQSIFQLDTMKMSWLSKINMLGRYKFHFLCNICYLVHLITKILYFHFSGYQNTHVHFTYRDVTQYSQNFLKCMKILDIFITKINRKQISMNREWTDSFSFWKHKKKKKNSEKSCINEHKCYKWGTIYVSILNSFKNISFLSK